MEQSRDFQCVLLCVVQIFNFLIRIWRFEFSIDQIFIVNFIHFQVQTFSPVSMLSKHTGRVRDSMQALWSRLKEGGQQVPEISWDLEEGGHSTSEVGVEDLPPSANLSLVLSIPTPVTPYGTTPSSPLSNFVWHSPALSSQPHNPYGPTPPSPLSDLVWSSPISNEDTTPCLSSESTVSIREPHHMVPPRARRKKAKTGNIFSLT